MSQKPITLEQYKIHNDKIPTPGAERCLGYEKCTIQEPKNVKEKGKKIVFKFSSLNSLLFGLVKKIKM